MNEQEAEVLAVALRTEVDALQVVDRASYDLADSINKKAYEAKKAFHAWFDPIDEASKRQRQATIAQGKKIDEPLEYVIKTTGAKQAAWYRAEQARIAEERRKAEEEARRKAEDEAIARAEALKAEGMTAAAEEALTAPVVVEAPKIAEPVKSEGVFYREVYGAEVLDLMTLVRAVAEGKAPASAVCADTAWIGRWARLTKGAETIPGVKVTVQSIQGRR